MRGLQARFYLSKGKFVLTEGVEKSRDSIWFYIVYDKFRIYTSDFGANFVTLVQKPISALVQSRNIILGKLRTGIQKYVPNVLVRNIDIGYTARERKDFSLMIEYTSVQENKNNINDVVFV